MKWILCKLGRYLLLCCALQLTLCGCVPAFYTYWAPRAESGKLSSHGQLAHSSTIEFTFDDAKLSFTGQGTLVGIGVRNPEGKSVSFTSDKADVYIPEKKQVIFDLQNYEGEHFNPTIRLQRSYYWSHIVFSDSEKSAYTIKMPDVIVNGRRYAIPEIQFTKGKGLGIFG